MATATTKPVEPRPAVFNERTLKYYDWLLEFTCNRVWHCSIRRTLELYRRHLSSNHLEVGVGTGYFLDHSHLPGSAPRLALLDLSPDCLKHTAARLNSGGVLFGSTVLRQGVRCDPGARAFMRLYNARKAFFNLQDGLAGLTQALEKNFRNVRIDVIGCVAQFSGTT
jgi:hypothetical protein